MLLYIIIIISSSSSIIIVIIVFSLIKLPNTNKIGPRRVKKASSIGLVWL